MSLDRSAVTDGVIAAATLAFALLALTLEGATRDELTPVVGAVAVISCVALVGRQRWPIPVLVVVAAARLVVTADVGSDLALTPAVMIALYTATRHRRSRIDLWIALAVGFVSALAVTALEPDEGFARELVGEGALMLLPVAMGEAMRARAERVRAMIDAEAAARVEAERLRIARDLHDVVTHGLSTITIQAGVAAHLFERDPEQARRALEVINDTGRRSLDELRSMVGVLRGDEAAPRTPTPSVDDSLATLIDGARAAGLDATLRSRGQFPPDADTTTLLALHRIVQEALTNVARHAGPVAVAVVVDHGPDRVAVHVANAPPSVVPAATAPSAGVGILGMTERAASVGGEFEAGPTDDGGFEVRAVLPYRSTP